MARAINPIWLKNIVSEDSTLNELLRNPEINYKVEKRPVYVECKGEMVKGKGFNVIKIMNGKEVPIGNVGGRYQVVQNEEMLHLAYEIQQQDIKVSKIIMLGEHKETMMIFFDATPVSVFKDDTINPTLVILLDHRGKYACSLGVLNLRMYCFNVLGMLQYSYRHTRNVKERLTEAKTSMIQARKNNEKTIERYRAYTEVTLTQEEMRGYLKNLFSSPTTENTSSKYLKIEETIFDLIETDELILRKNSAWGLLNGVSKYLQLQCVDISPERYLIGSGKAKIEKLDNHLKELL